MTEVERLARFVHKASFEEISAEALEELKKRLLDAIACAVGALGAEPVQMVRAHTAALGGEPLASLIAGAMTAPDRAAFHNAFLVRYLDYNDAYLAAGETCHPSDNIGAVLAAAEHAGASGRDFLVGLAVAYQIQCRLSDEAPVHHRGFDHTVQGSYAAAAGAAKSLGLSEAGIANAVAISGTAYNALRVTRTGEISHWKGLAYPSTCWTATHSALLAARGITGPREVFEGNKGFFDAIAGEFSVDWEQEDLERVRDTIIKKYNAEIHSQSTLEGLIELRERHEIDCAEIASVEISTFDVAFNIIGGGEEGAKKDIRRKEEADHSLPYMAAVALLDGEVLPGQYGAERIRADDVQALLRKVEVRPLDAYSARFPGEMACDIKIRFRDGREIGCEKADYEGFTTRPASWDFIAWKLAALAGGRDGDLLTEITQTVRTLEDHPIERLSALLRAITDPARAGA